LRVESQAGLDVASARAISSQLCPLARASCTRCGSHRSAWVDEAGDQGHGGDVVAEPGAAAVG